MERGTPDSQGGAGRRALRAPRDGRETRPIRVSPTARLPARPARCRSTATPCACCRTPRRTIPAWLAAIRGAEQSILFENYIFDDDDVGREFAEALAAKARAGIDVRIVYDWLGSRRAGDAVAAVSTDRVRSVLGVQPAASRQSAGLAHARSSQDAHRRRTGRVRLGTVRQREVARRSGATDGTLARHRHRDPRAGGRRDRARVRDGLARVRRRAAAA